MPDVACFYIGEWEGFIDSRELLEDYPMRALCSSSPPLL